MEGDKRQQIASALEDLVGSLQPGSSSPVELEKLKAGLSLVVEDQKTKLAEAAEDGHTWLDITKGVTPLLVTGVLGLVGSLVTLRWQSKDAVAAGDRQAQQLQASEEAKARQDRTALLQQLAQSVSSGPRPSPSCWYVQGIWSDYSKDEPLPDVLASRCSAGYAEDGGLALGPTPDGGVASAGAQWVIVIESDTDPKVACDGAQQALRDGLKSVQVLREESRGVYATTSGEFSIRPDAIGYLQRVRSVRANAYIARQYAPRWSWYDCTTSGGSG